MNRAGVRSVDVNRCALWAHATKSVWGRVKIWKYPRRKYWYGKDVGGADHSEVTGNNRESFGRMVWSWFEKAVCDGNVCVRTTAMWFSTNGTFLCQMHQYLPVRFQYSVTSKNVLTVLTRTGLIMHQKTLISIVSPALRSVGEQILQKLQSFVLLGSRSIRSEISVST